MELSAKRGCRDVAGDGGEEGEEEEEEEEEEGFGFFFWRVGNSAGMATGGSAVRAARAGRLVRFGGGVVSPILGKYVSTNTGKSNARKAKERV